MSRRGLALLLLAACDRPPPDPAPRYREQISRALHLTFTDADAAAFEEAAGWLSERKDPETRIRLELVLEREFVRRKRLPDRALRAAALGLGRYPESAAARDVLWAALADPRERAGVRAACLKSLQAFHPQDLTERILEVKAEAGDAWLLELQAKLRG